MHPIKIFLLTGFLGAGKTTLMKNLLIEFRDHVCGIIENDFGEINIDSITISQSQPHQSIELIEINNGSIFCSCRQDCFIEALLQIAQKPIEYLFIESSGLGDPTPIIQDLQIIEKKIGERFQLEQIICVIDTENLPDLMETTMIIERQIKLANIALLNKLDLVSLKNVKIIEKKIRKINPLCRIIKTTYSKITKREIITPITLNPNNNNIENGLNNPGNRPFNITLYSERIFDKKQITEFLIQLSPFLIRIKGYIQFSDHWAYVDGVNGKWTITDILQNQIHPKSSEIVFIFGANTDGTLLERIPKIWQEMGEK